MLPTTYTPSLHKCFGVRSLLLWLVAKSHYAPLESVLAIPSLGLQLETHRGLPGIPLFVSRRFIPAIYLQDVIINEGLRRWDVRYYLAAMQSSKEGGFTLKVAYEVCSALLTAMSSHNLNLINLEHPAILSCSPGSLSRRARGDV